MTGSTVMPALGPAPGRRLPEPLETAGPLNATLQRLRAEFAEVLDPSTIVRAVQKCRRDLAGAPHGAMPELVERLARQDLTDLVERPGPSRASDDQPGIGVSN